ncbi:MAG: exodeoxyribonuclease VII small subunit, partial [Deltaproteobacteria bacterium]|nr:exodeoxyribonuclease VII small subunit [Deltaproteobacteria bacterium]
MTDPKKGRGPSAPAPAPTFEQDMERLKSLVASLESHSLDLDRAITTFEEGIKLSRTLSEKLTQAEARLEEITRAADGALAAAPAPPGGWGQPQSAAQAARRPDRGQEAARAAAPPPPPGAGAPPPPAGG